MKTAAGEGSRKICYDDIWRLITVYCKYKCKQIYWLQRWKYSSLAQFLHLFMWLTIWNIFYFFQFSFLVKVKLEINLSVRTLMKLCTTFSLVKLFAIWFRINKRNNFYNVQLTLSILLQSLKHCGFEIILLTSLIVFADILIN